MTLATALAELVPGSHRDPAGGVYRLGDRILRTVAPDHDAEFAATLRTGMLDRFADSGRIVAFEPLSGPPAALGLAGASRVLEHPRLPFISYPYEWSFEALRAAGLHYLDLHLEAMEGGLTLSDASAYNIQFLGTDPIFIDLLSFRPYRDGEIWSGYRQFCEQFLNPLLLSAKTGVMPNAWYRGALEGVRTSDLRRLLPWRALLSRRVLLHVVAHSALEDVAQTSLATKEASVAAALPRESFLRVLGGMRAWLGSLAPKRVRSRWADYPTTCSYTDEERTAKHAEVSRLRRRAAAENALGARLQHGRIPAARSPIRSRTRHRLGRRRSGRRHGVPRRAGRRRALHTAGLRSCQPEPEPGVGSGGARRHARALVR